MSISSAVFGCLGTGLTEAERGFFKEAAPWGFILFARNIDTPDQVRRLVSDLRSTVGREAPVLIDQEGGRVARLRPPHWRAYPPARRYGEIYEKDPEAGREAARLGGRLIGCELKALGIDVDCLPLLDVPLPEAHEIIGDRAYSAVPDEIAQLGRAAAEGLMDAGVLPVIKHIPGHGRALADSHEHLPVVTTALEELRRTDFAPFKALADLPIGMTAHVIYEACDSAAPATLSKTVIDEIVRGEIGFDGLLMSDDLSMKALAGSYGERTAGSLAAGCDLVLHCNGEMSEMVGVMDGTSALEGEALRRAEAVDKFRKAVEPFDEAEAVARFNALTLQKT